MIFDFETYLTNLCPGSSYTVEKVIGGVVNATDRARKNNLDDEDRFKNHRSLILKYAPPYIAGLGENVPMSQFRQTIEARALELFLPTNQSSINDILSSSGILVPELLLHDPNDYILIMSDLGTLPTLSEMFHILGGYASFNKPLKILELPWADRDLNNIELDYFRKTGLKLGKFFAKLHSRETITNILNTIPRSHLASENTEEIILQRSIRPLRNQLLLFPHQIQDHECNNLYERLESNFIRPTETTEQCFIQGDCWTGAVLVEIPDINTNHNSNPKVGVIDWEFASIGRGPNGDMSQLMAHLEMFHIAADHRSKEIPSSYSQALGALQKGLTFSYSHHRSNKTPNPNVGRGKENSTKLNSKSLEAKIIRSSFLSHAAEIINSAFWKVWICHDDDCMIEKANDDDDGGGGGDAGNGKIIHTNVEHECLLVQKMMARAVWFLRRACKNEEEFCDEQNWKLLLEESQRLKGLGRGWLFDLFFSDI